MKARDDWFLTATGRRVFVTEPRVEDICIEDIDAENIRAHVPAWYRKAVKACGVVLFPLVLKGRTVPSGSTGKSANPMAPGPAAVANGGWMARG